MNPDLKSQRTLRAETIEARATDEAQTIAAELKAAHDARIARRREELAPLLAQLAHCRLDRVQQARLDRMVDEYLASYRKDDIQLAGAAIRTFLRARLLDSRSCPEIPADERKAIERALKKQGVEPTDEVVRALYLEGKPKCPPTTTQ